MTKYFPVFLTALLLAGCDDIDETLIKIGLSEEPKPPFSYYAHMVYQGDSVLDGEITYFVFHGPFEGSDECFDWARAQANLYKALPDVSATNERCFSSVPAIERLAIVESPDHTPSASSWRHTQSRRNCTLNMTDRGDASCVSSSDPSSQNETAE